MSMGQTFTTRRWRNDGNTALLSLGVPAQAWPKKHQKGQEETSPSHDEWRTDISETIIITTVMLIKSSSSSIGGGAAFTHSGLMLVGSGNLFHVLFDDGTVAGRAE